METKKTKNMDKLQQFDDLRARQDADRNRKNYWHIEGDNNTFKTLRDAKIYIHSAYTDRERNSLNGGIITHMRNGEPVSIVKITVIDGRASYSRIQKLRKVKFWNVELIPHSKLNTQNSTLHTHENRFD